MTVIVLLLTSCVCFAMVMGVMNNLNQVPLTTIFRLVECGEVWIGEFGNGFIEEKPE